MSKVSRAIFFAAALVLVVAFVTRVYFGAWLNLNSVLVALSGGLIVLAMVIDWKLYWEFLTMRTTKHGMNAGALILMTLTVLVCVNYLANRHNKTWDVTKEKLHSLSEQSEKVLDGLKDDLEVKVFYKGAEGQEERMQVKQTLSLYQGHGGKLRATYVNAYVDSILANEYLKDLPDRESAQLVAFVENKGRRIRVEPPFDEAQFTSAMIRATRENLSKVYFVKGHGEKDIDADQDFGLKSLVDALTEASFKVEALSLIDKKEVPADASVVVIAGPQLAYLESELEWLRAYAAKGGKLFIALDPGQRHNLANLTKPFGVQFANNFVIATAQVAGGGPTTVLGRFFDVESEITRVFPSGASMAVFPLASEVLPAQEKNEEYVVTNLVKSDPGSFTMADPTKPLATKPKMEPVSLAVQVKAAAGEFEAVIFGDSDFMSNRAFFVGVNRDLALNVIAHLANQKDLISIKPKLPAGTTVVLTGWQRFGLVIAGITMPLVLLIMAAIIWYRRRGA